MVISFSSDPAFEHLMEYGLVYTYRAAQRKQLGRTWLNRGRGEPKLCDVYIKELEQRVPPEPRFLAPYYLDTGFLSVSAWIREIDKVNGSRPDHGCIYLISTLPENPEA